MSRAKYLRHLEQTVIASQKVIDNLTKELHEVKQLLEHKQDNARQHTQHS